MGKKANFRHQFQTALRKQTRYGESKHQAKIDAKNKAKELGVPYEPISGIFSKQTYKNYSDVCQQFSNYVIKNHPEIKNYQDSRKYVEEWLEFKQDKELSAWSLHMYASALASSFNCKIKDFNFDFPERRRADVKRCRDENGSDYRNTNPRFNTVKDFVRGTGARRQGLMKLRTTDIRQRTDGEYEIFLREKGGKERWALVNPQYKDTVLKVFESSKGYEIANGEVRLFRSCDIPRNSIHDLRADYACDIYDYYAEHGFASGELYYCRRELAGISYDKELMRLTSAQLGHSRLDVVVSYLYKK